MYIYLLGCTHSDYSQIKLAISVKKKTEVEPPADNTEYFPLTLLNTDMQAFFFNSKSSHKKRQSGSPTAASQGTLETLFGLRQQQKTERIVDAATD